MKNSINNCPLLISIVSHGHKKYVLDLLEDLNYLSHELNFEVVLTINTKNEFFEDLNNFKFKIHLIQNDCSLGFGANHNQAFNTFTDFNYFLILNPDIRIDASKFSFLTLINFLEKNHEIGVIAPFIIDSCNTPSSQIRNFPTFKSILLRNLGILDDSIVLKPNSGLQFGDWIGGMFMLISSTKFKEINGFDEKNFFMYLEDSYLCYELTKKQYAICVHTDLKITHYGQHKSKRNLKHFYWHLTSLIKFLKLTR